MKKWAMALLALIVLATAQAALAADEFALMVNGSIASGNTFVLSPGNTLTIDVVAEGIYKDLPVTWSSSNEKVAIVDLGMVFAQDQEGYAQISAYVSVPGRGSVGRVLVVQVKRGAADTIVTVRAEGGTTLQVDDTVQLIAQVSPSDVELKWSSANTAVAQVDQQGLVTGKKPGTAKITVAAQDGSKASASLIVTVTKGASGITQLKLNRATATLYVGGVTDKFKNSFKLTAAVKPAGMAGAVEWSSANEDVATVSGGKVVAHKAGKATIRAKAGGKTASCVVTVYKLPTKVDLPNTGKLKVRGKFNLAKELTMDGSVTRVKWSSSNKKVVKVSSKGVVLGIKPGKAKVKVTAVNGKSAICVVTVVR